MDSGSMRVRAPPLDREFRGVVSAGMTAIHGVALFVAAYLLLLGRNAWKQGELGQFLWALAMVAGLLGIISLGVLAWGWLFGP